MISKSFLGESGYGTTYGIWIFLFQNLFNSTASHDVDRIIKRSVCHISDIVLVA